MFLVEPDKLDIYIKKKNIYRAFYLSCIIRRFTGRKDSETNEKFDFADLRLRYDVNR